MVPCVLGLAKISYALTAPYPLNYQQILPSLIWSQHCTGHGSPMQYVLQVSDYFQLMAALV